MNLFKKLGFLIVTGAMVLGVGLTLSNRGSNEVRAESTTVTVTRDDFTGESGYALGTWSKGALSGEGVIYFTTTSYIQVSTTAGRQPYPYNLVAAPGPITSISVTMPGAGSLRTLTPRMSASAPVSSPTGGTALEVKTFTSTTETLTWTISSGLNYKFFQLVPGGNTNWANFQITYEESVQEFGTLDHIDLDTTNAKLNYYVGDTFTMDGLTVIAYDTVDYSKILSSGYTSDFDGVTFASQHLGTQTVTVSYTEGAITKTAIYDIEVEEMPDWQMFTKVTSLSDLHVGANYVIGGTKSDVVWAMSTIQSANNRTAIEATMNGAVIVETEDTQIFVLEEGIVADTYAFKAVNGDTAGQYIYAASSEKNYLRSQETNDANGSWAIEISGGITSATAQGNFTRNQLKLNSSSALFAAYNNGQEDIDLYLDLNSVPETPYDEALSFAQDVNSGEGLNAHGNCEAVLTSLTAKYNNLSSEAKTIFDSSTDAAFVSARARMDYLANWVAAQGSSGSHEIISNVTSRNALIISLVIGIIGFTTILGFYFLKKKKETL